MTENLLGHYIGPIKELRGAGAILRDNGDDMYLAQFNDLRLGMFHTHTWQLYPKTNWKVECSD